MKALTGILAALAAIFIMGASSLAAAPETPPNSCETPVEGTPLIQLDSGRELEQPQSIGDGRSTL